MDRHAGAADNAAMQARSFTSYVGRATLAAFLGVGLAAQTSPDSDGDGLPDHKDSCPRVSFEPGFDWRACPPLDLDPRNNTSPEGKARERVAAWLLSQPDWVGRCSFAIVRRGRVHFADAFEQRSGNTLAHDPAGVHRLFRIGSTTKPMVVTLAKILERQQVLSLGDHVDDEDGSQKLTNGQRTLRQLLTHQGAFKLDDGAVHLYAYPGGLAAFWKEKDDLVSPHYTSARYGNLGGGFEYSAFNYTLAGAYLENRARESLESLLQRHVFDALSMCTATVDGQRAAKAPVGGNVGVCRNASRHLGPYINLVAPKDPLVVDNFYSSNDVYGVHSYVQQSYRLDECASHVRDAAGGVIASSVDLAHFARGLLDSYHGRGGPLRRAELLDVWTPTHDYGCGANCIFQPYYATGFFVSSHPSKPMREVEHAGSRAGYQSAFVLRPESDLAISILVNANVDAIALDQLAKTILDDFEAAEATAWIDFGQGCPGTAPRLGPFLAINQGGTFVGNALPPGTEFALQVQTPRAGTIRGFELYTSGRGEVKTALVAADAQGRPAAILARGAMYVDDSLGWYRSVLDVPVTVPPGQALFLSFDTGSTGLASSLRQGDPVPYWTRTASGPWTAAPAQPWALRVLEQEPGFAVPRLTASADAIVGGRFTLQLRSVAGPAALLSIGASRTSWGPLSLPFDLGVLGARDCWVLAEGLIQIAAVRDGSGTVLAAIPVPGSSSFAGTRLYVQGLALDASANGLGLVTSQAAAVRVRAR